MRRTVVAVALVLLAGCAPEWEDRDGWENTGDLSAVQARVEVVLQAAHEFAPCDFRWGGWIVWTPEPWELAGVLWEGEYIHGGHRAEVKVAGAPWCSDAPEGVLDHELAHYMIDRCDGEPGHGPAWQALHVAIGRRAAEIVAGP